MMDNTYILYNFFRYCSNLSTQMNKFNSHREVLKYRTQFTDEETDTKR